MQIVENLSQEQLQAFRGIERNWRDLLKKGIFYAEGEQVFTALLRSPVVFSTVLISPGLMAKFRSFMEQRSVQVNVIDKSSMEAITGRRLNQGIVALGKVPEMHQLEFVLNKERCCIVALNGIDHAVNVGSILRNCAAFGIAGVCFDSATIHPYCWRVIKSSIGGVFRLPLYSTSELFMTLKILQNEGFEMIAADPSATMTIRELKRASKVCLIFGNEHDGISPSILDLEVKRVSIPMKNVDSINVASASAIFLHQILSLTSNSHD